MQNVFSLLKANVLKPRFVVAKRENIEAIFGVREEMGAHACLGQENTGTLFFWLHVGGGFCYLAVCFCQVAKHTWF